MYAAISNDPTCPVNPTGVAEVFNTRDEALTALASWVPSLWDGLTDDDGVTEDATYEMTLINAPTREALYEKLAKEYSVEITEAGVSMQPNGQPYS